MTDDLVMQVSIAEFKTCRHIKVANIPHNRIKIHFKYVVNFREEGQYFIL